MIFKSVLNKRTGIIFFNNLRDYDLNGCAQKTEFRGHQENLYCCIVRFVYYSLIPI